MKCEGAQYDTYDYQGSLTVFVCCKLKNGCNANAQTGVRGTLCRQHHL